MSNKAIVYLIITIFFWVKSFKEPRLGLSFFAAIFFIRPETIAYSQLDMFHIPLVTGLFCFAGWFVNANGLGKPKQNSLLVTFALFYLITVVSTFGSVVYPLWRWSKCYFDMLVFCFLIFRIVVDKRSLNQFTIGIMMGGLFLSYWGVLQYFQGNYRLEGLGGRRFGSNEIGAIIASTAPFFYMKAMGKIPSAMEARKRLYEQLGFAAGVPGVVCCVIFTGSRGAFLGLMTGIFMLLLRSEKKVKALVIAVACFPLLVPMLPQEYKDRMNTIFKSAYVNIAKKDNNNFEYTDETVDGSVKGRIIFWKAAVAMAKDYPLFGVGPQNFELLTPVYTHGLYGRKDTHNTYLKIAAELGLTGFSVYMMLIVYAGMNLLKSRQRLNKTEDTYFIFYRHALEAALCSLLVSGLFSSYNYTEPLYWYLFLTASLMGIVNKNIEVRNNSDI